ncbi:MAG: peptidase [Nocardioides sp.]|nr:peptidase [Nocardioides sp.]
MPHRRPAPRTAPSAVLAALTALLLAVVLVPGATARDAGRASTVGAQGIGDPYWPLDGNGGIDVRHYDVRISYDPAVGRLDGTTTLRLRATQDLTAFHLDLLLPVTEVEVDGVAARWSRPGSHELRVVPATRIDRGQVVAVRVTYSGRPDDASYAGESNWLSGPREVVAVNQPHMAPWWFPSNDHPRDKATFDVTVTGPVAMQAISNGTLVSRTEVGTKARTHWRSADPMATYLAFFALGRYQVERGRIAGLPYYNAVSRSLDPDLRATALRQLRGSARITARLADRLGPYPFESTGGLATGLPLWFALENQTRPVYPGWAIDRSLLVHELGHQWFGDSVAVGRWRDIWLNEGFATFLEHWDVEQRGGTSATTWLRRAHAERRNDATFWRLDIADPGPGRVFDNRVYERGAMAVQALRDRLGERVFWKALRTWLAARRDGVGTVPAFRRHVQRVSGKDLRGFFRTWLSGRRAPDATRANGLR